jgi:uncharacterized protein (TIGR03435 family)
MGIKSLPVYSVYQLTRHFPERIYKMMRALAGLCLAALLVETGFGQSTDPKPTFDVADVHISPRTTTPVFRTSFRGERYEVHNATMLDLIRTAYSIDAEKVSGGPSWLEYYRFDIAALAPRDTTQDKIKLMLQSLLAERFKLAVHNDTKPIAGFVLSVGKGKPKLKEADASGKTGCQTQPVQLPPPTPGQINVPMIGISCHNITMEAFVTELKGTAGAGYITNAVVDSTGLKGAWDFDYKLTSKFLLQLVGTDGAVTLSDAMDKQLGLKLEEQKLPTAVIVVDQVDQKPGDNPPEVAKKLPPPPLAEFEVADIKPTNIGAPLQTLIAGGIGVQTGGRVNLPGAILPLKQLIALAWNLNTTDDIPGAPKWLDSARYDIIAKLPASFISANGAVPPLQDLGPMLQAMLIDRFKMKFHFEDRMVTAYSLVSAKPKLKKADPSNRTGCKQGNTGVLFLNNNNGGLTVPPSTVTCQNMTMSQFAEQLQGLATAYVHFPVIDVTGLEGGYDFSFSYSPISESQLAQLRSSFAAAQGPAGGAAGASDPSGGTSIFDAVEKQLGLKLEAQKRTYPVFVIDHIDEKPTDN